MKNPVYIAGIGVITAIGNSVDECFSSLKNENAGIEAIRFIETVHSGKIPVAEVKLNNSALQLITGMPENTSRTTMLGFLAAKEALLDSGVQDDKLFRKGFVSANTVGGMDKSEDFFKDFIKNRDKGKLRFVHDHECGCVTEKIAEALGITDFFTTISTACSSSANAIAYAARLINNDLLDIAIAGGCDALTKFTLNGFHTLMILDEELCKPFDENRNGLNLGEGAGYVVLISEKIANILSKKMYCKLSGYYNSNDAYHQTASSPEGTGPYLAMQNAMKKSGLKPSDINYINLHGTGTPNNDQSESMAIKRIFDPVFPLISSTKAYTGHTLGGCGGVEAVFSILALKHRMVFPNLRLETPMHEFTFSPVNKFLKEQQLNHVMSNSFGFGGNCASLIFSKI